jgi:hypothetical protein
MIVLIVYSALITSGLVILGRSYPAHRGWSYVDAVYYPLGILGVCFLFFSNIDTKENAARQFDATFEVMSQEEELTDRVSNAYLELFKFLAKPLRLDADCREENSRTTFYQTFCTPNGRDIRAFVVAVSDVKQQGMDVGYMTACNGFSINQERLMRRQSLKPLAGELAEAEYRMAVELVGVIAGACGKYVETMARPRHERIMQNVVERQRQVPGRRSSLIHTLIFYAQEWLWPFVLILALALKVGKTAAGLRRAVG